MADKFMYIPNDATQNYPFIRLQLEVETLDTQPNELTNQNSIKFPKVFKRYYKTLGTSVKKQPNFPSLPGS